MLNEVKHLAIVWEILRCAQNDIVHHLTYDKTLVQWRMKPDKMCGKLDFTLCIFSHFPYNFRLTSVN
jgi:hypothetical protein